MGQTNFILLVMYDVSTETAESKKAYRALLRYLKHQGFYGMQESLYMKPLSEKHKAQRYLYEIEKLASDKSHIRALVLPHSTFLRMITVAGDDSFGEGLIKNPQSVLCL